MARSPETYASPQLFEIGIGEVVVCRFKNDGRVEAGIFLVDVFCLGVKNAFYDVFPSEEAFREEILSHSLADVPAQPGSWGRKLVEGAVEYARSLGISPHPEYKKGARVFGGIKSEECPDNFVFGRNGRPFFIKGPDDAPETCERILTALRIRLGEEGFDFEMAEAAEDGTIYAFDSDADAGDPHPELVAFAEEFLEKNDDLFDDIFYAGRTEAPIAATLLQASLEFHKTARTEGLPNLTFDQALHYMVTIYNLRYLDPEDRDKALQGLPEDMVEALTLSAEDADEAESPLFILAARSLPAGQPDPTRLFLLIQTL